MREAPSGLRWRRWLVAAALVLPLAACGSRSTEIASARPADETAPAAMLIVRTVDAAGEPLAAVVEVYRLAQRGSAHHPGPPDTTLPAGPTPLVDGATTADGVCEFAAVAGNAWLVVARAPGRALSTGVALRHPEGGRAETTLCLASGELLEGRAVDEAGEPAAGVHLFFGPPSLGDSQDGVALHVRAVTDDEGWYSVDRLVPADTEVWAAKERSYPRRSARVNPVHVNRLDLRVVARDEGDWRGDWAGHGVRPDPAQSPALARGRVVGPDGAPVPGAFVRLHVERPRLGSVASGHPGPGVWTLPDGRYILPIPPGSVFSDRPRLLVRAPDLAPYIVSVSEGDTEQTIVPPPAQPTSVLVVDESGDPVPDAWLFLVPRVPPDRWGLARGEPLDFGPFFDGRTDERGTATLECPVGAALDLCVRSDLCCPAEVPIAPGDSALRVVLRRLGSLAGVVRHPDGKPVGPARIRIQRVEPDARIGLWVTNSSIDTMDGHFRFDRLVPGTYVVYTASSDEGASPVPVTRSAVFDVGDVETDIVVPRPMTVEGRVRGVDGRPVAGAQVYVRVPELPNGLLPQTRTDEDGRFRLEGMGPERFTLLVIVSAWGDGGLQSLVVRRSDLSPTAGPFDIPVGGGAAIDGVLTDAEGRPIRGETLSVSPVGAEKTGERSGRHWSQTTTDRLGRFRIEGLAPGLYEFRRVPGSSGWSRQRPGISGGSGVVAGASGISLVEERPRDD